MPSSSGRTLANEYTIRLKDWIAQRDAQQDYLEYERAGKINRTILCQELDFGRSVLTQNPAAKACLLEAERRWFGNPQPKDTQAHDAARERAETRSTRTNRQLNIALDENAKLRAENALLRRRLKKYETLQEVLLETGRVPRT